MTASEALEIRNIGLKTIESKGILKKWAEEHGYSDRQVIEVVQAKTANELEKAMTMDLKDTLNRVEKGCYVRLNDRYAEYEDHKDEVFKVISDPWKTASGDELVLLNHGFKGGYAVDGLTVLKGFSE